jgi:hypothetical protein
MVKKYNNVVIRKSSNPAKKLDAVFSAHLEDVQKRFHLDQQKWMITQ